MSVIERIPFSVRMSEASFRGEVLGNGLKSDSIFEVRLNNGDMFHIKAETDLELRAYAWTSYCKDQFRKLVPIVGRMIERHFKKKQ